MCDLITYLQPSQYAHSHTHTHTHTPSGADLYAKDNNCCTPAHIAAKHQCADTFHCLMECIPDNTSVIFTSFEVESNKEMVLKV